jgi:hypothetical protein
MMILGVFLEEKRGKRGEKGDKNPLKRGKKYQIRP